MCRESRLSYFYPTLWGICVGLLLTNPTFAASRFLPMEGRASQDIQQLSLYSESPIVRWPIRVATANRLHRKLCSPSTLSSSNTLLFEESQNVSVPSVNAYQPQRVFKLCRQVARSLAKFRGLATGSIRLSKQSWQQPDAIYQQNDFGLSSAHLTLTASYGVQVSDSMSVTIGGNYAASEQNFEGSVLTFGQDRWQVDLGYQTRWWSPFADSAIILSHNAASMPSIGFSSTKGLSDWRLRFEVFVARQSTSDKINRSGLLQSGQPYINGFHLSMTPIDNLTLSFNRIMQYGGGESTPSLADIINGFFDPSSNDNSTQLEDGQIELGNQVASLAAKYHFQFSAPLAIYAEYGGEDASASTSFRLGNAALGVGLEALGIIPSWVAGLDVKLETRQWQNGWYVHHIYGDGLTHKGDGFGAWPAMAILQAGGRAIGGVSQYLELNWRYDTFLAMALKHRTVTPEYDYGTLQGKKLTESALSAQYDYQEFELLAQLVVGEDLLERSLNRLGLSVGVMF